MSFTKYQSFCSGLNVLKDPISLKPLFYKPKYFAWCTQWVQWPKLQRSFTCTNRFHFLFCTQTVHFMDANRWCTFYPSNVWSCREASHNEVDISKGDDKYNDIKTHYSMVAEASMPLYDIQLCSRFYSTIQSRWKHKQIENWLETILVCIAQCMLSWRHSWA